MAKAETANAINAAGTTAAKKTKAPVKTGKSAADKKPPAAPKLTDAKKMEKPLTSAPKTSRKTAKVAKPVEANASATEKIKKAKLVRDSFTMPEQEYAVLGEVKKACLKAGFEVKKSELLRVGVALVKQLDLAKLKDILASLPALKAGRPKKHK